MLKFQLSRSQRCRRTFAECCDSVRGGRSQSGEMVKIISISILIQMSFTSDHLKRVIIMRTKDLNDRREARGI